MTREELFSVFPRPWRISQETSGSVVDANGAEVLVVDHNCERDDDDVLGLIELLVDLGNQAEE